MTTFTRTTLALAAAFTLGWAAAAHAEDPELDGMQGFHPPVLQWHSDKHATAYSNVDKWRFSYQK